MTTPTTAPSTRREPDLVGQTVVVIGASAGIGLETARRARAEGAEVILTGRNPERLSHAARELGAQATRRCLPRSSATDSTPGAISCPRPSPSGVSWVRPMSRPSPCTS
jgi:D-arabinose 1-dehydrogenase-like Zn-dependent alcohol dehydrogenase